MRRRLGEQGRSCSGWEFWDPKNERLTIPFGTAPCPSHTFHRPARLSEHPESPSCAKGWEEKAGPLLPPCCQELSGTLPSALPPGISTQPSFAPWHKGSPQRFPVNQILVSLLTALFLNGISPSDILCFCILECKMDKNPQPFS